MRLGIQTEGSQSQALCLGQVGVKAMGFTFSFFLFWNRVAQEARRLFFLHFWPMLLSSWGLMSFFFFQTSLKAQACPDEFVLPWTPGLLEFL